MLSALSREKIATDSSRRVAGFACTWSRCPRASAARIAGTRRLCPEIGRRRRRHHGGLAKPARPVFCIGGKCARCRVTRNAMLRAGPGLKLSRQRGRGRLRLSKPQTGGRDVPLRPKKCRGDPPRVSARSFPTKPRPPPALPVPKRKAPPPLKGKRALPFVPRSPRVGRKNAHRPPAAREAATVKRTYAALGRVCGPAPGAPAPLPPSLTPAGSRG
jgi:hypothetical protein